MILDERLEFADATSVAASSGTTTLIGDVIPLTVARNLGTEKSLYLVIQTATEIITGGSAGTIYFQLVSDATSTVAVDDSATVHLTTPIFVTDDAAANSAALNAGGIIAVMQLPGEGNVYEAWLGLLCKVVTTTVTAGAINAFITTDVKQWKALTSAVGR